MKYHLLTGATGLLGSYLLRDAAHAGIPLAVLTRATRRDSARQRIEDIMLRWEKQAGASLPRPVVLEGDLSQSDLGLQPTEQEWIAEHCDAVIHNAASLLFVKKDDSDEPYRTNVDGTGHLLSLCERAGIRRFHHVSTAYVCGLREGRVLERELDEGQELGNDYERSKLTAEQLVRNCPWLDELTVFRPGIIVGDSRTGYTSTFHGFYVPLKIAHGLIYKVAQENHVRGSDLLQLVGMTGTERKNFVPVDWVSGVMMRVVAHAALHGRTYHLTPRDTVPLQEMVEVMEEVIVDNAPKDQDAAEISRYSFDATFRDQLDVYRAYWRDDPVFDTTATSGGAPDLPCPSVDRAMLTRLCKYAVRSGFGWPRSPSVKPAVDTDAWLRSVVALRPEPAEWYFGLQINGAGGGQWELAVHGDLIGGIQPGVTDRCDGVLHMNAHTLGELMDGVRDGQQALREGRLWMRVGEQSAARLLDVFQLLLTSPVQPGVAVSVLP